MNNLESLMFEHSEQMMLLVEPDSLRIIAANRSVGRKLGYSANELLARTITDVESSLQDVFYWEDVRNGQYQAIESQEGLFLCADGSILPVSKSVRIVEYDGRPKIFLQARDTQTERRIAEELAQALSQLQVTLESTGNGILVIDWQGRITNMNRLFSGMWNIPAALLVEHNDAAILDFVAANVVQTENYRRRLGEIVDPNETKDIFELHDGRVIECRSRPQYSGENIVGRVFSYDDITERKQQEEMLRQSRDLLEKRVVERTAELRGANAALLAEKDRQEELIRKLADTQAQLLQSEKMASIGQLAAGVAHEINNPVGFVSSNLNTLKNYVDDLLRLIETYEASETDHPVQPDKLTAAKREIDLAFLREDIVALLAESRNGLDRVKKIVQDLKDFSHSDTAEWQKADLNAGLESTLNVVWNELKYKAEMVKAYGDLPEVTCLPGQINQVFMNLLINAAHAIQERGTITLRTSTEDGGVCIAVTDTGCGIAPENMKRIFDPFFTTKPVGKGTGLGLSLSYSIVQKHHGRIEVASKLGKGTTFSVHLPLRQPEATTDG